MLIFALMLVGDIIGLPLINLLIFRFLQVGKTSVKFP